MDDTKISTCIDDAKTALKRGNQCLSGAIFHTFSGFVTAAQHYNCSAACRLLCKTTIHLVFQRINLSFPNNLGLVLHKMHAVSFNVASLCLKHLWRCNRINICPPQFFTESGDLLLACRVWIIQSKSLSTVLSCKWGLQQEQALLGLQPTEN
jgi:hypothetical protein